MSDKPNDPGSPHDSSPENLENIEALEAELIQLAEDSSKSPKNPDDPEKTPLDEAMENYSGAAEEVPANLGESPIENLKDECGSPGENLNPFELDVAAIEESPKEATEARMLKKYQSTLQELKEEISKLNKQIELKHRLSRPDPSEEDLFRIRSVCRLTKTEAKRLRSEAEELVESNAQLSESIENLKDQSAAKPGTTEKVAALQQKVKLLEKEFSDLSKSNEISLKDLEKVLNPEVPQKFVNEFYVNVQKRIDSLETENSSLSTLVKKSSTELTKLKEKLENSKIRKKANDEIKNKLKALEDTYENYIQTEGRLKLGIKESLEEYSFYSDKPENQHDADSARNILKDMREQVLKLEAEEENLEFLLQEKKNLLRAAQVYGLQRSKTSNKLRSDMELLGMVLVEKEQAVSKLRKEIEELNIRTHKVQIDIKEVQEKKNSL